MGDTLAYHLTIQNNLPGAPTKNIDVADRFQQGTELLTSSVVCLRGTERFTCTPAPSRQFGLYVPNLEIRGGETLTISYQAKVVTSPVDLTLQLVDLSYLRDAVARGSLISSGTLFEFVETLINNVQVGSVMAKIPNIEKRKKPSPSLLQSSRVQG